VLVLIPESGRRWLAQFPDLPGCRAVGEQIELVIYEAAAVASNLLQGIRERGMEPPAPRPLEEVRADTSWAETQSIEWSKALISIVAIP
jgi:predicted RNase H-like HicB family nuclease